MKNYVNIENRKNRFEYEFIQTLTAGIQLTGTEVKGIRNGNVSLVDSFCLFNGNELFVRNINIPFDKQSFTHEPLRERKLLLKKQELKKLNKDLIDGLTIVPVRLFTSKTGIFKLEIALAKGKKIYDKRETIKKRDLDRESKRND